jgi:hypothetical protein
VLSSGTDDSKVILIGKNAMRVQVRMFDADTIWPPPGVYIILTDVASDKQVMRLRVCFPWSSELDVSPQERAEMSVSLQVPLPDTGEWVPVDITADQMRIMEQLRRLHDDGIIEVENPDRLLPTPDEAAADD